MGWRAQEMPAVVRSIGSSPHDVRAAISEAICPPAFAPFAARMLWAMGKTLPADVVTTEAAPGQVKRMHTKPGGVPYLKLLPLATPSGASDEDDNE